MKSGTLFYQRWLISPEEYYWRQADLSWDEADRRTEELHPEWKDDRSAWVKTDDKKEADAKPARRALLHRMLKDIRKEPSYLFANVFGEDEDIISQSLFDLSKTEAFTDAYAEAARLLDGLSSNKELMQGDIGALYQGIADISSGIGDTSSMVKQLEAKFKRDFTEDTKKELEAFFAILRGLDLTDAETKTAMNEVKEKIRESTKEALKSLDSSLQSLATSSGDVKLDSKRFGNVTSLVKMMAGLRGESMREMLSGEHKKWRSSLGGKTFESLIEERDAFLEYFLGEAFEDFVGDFFGKIDSLNGTHTANEAGRILRALGGAKREAMVDLAKSIEKDAKSLERDIKKTVDGKADLLGDTLLKYGITREEYDTDATVRKAVDRSVSAQTALQEAQGDARAKASIASRAEAAQRQYERLTLDEVTAEKLDARRSLQKEKGRDLTTDEAEMSDKLVELSHALQEAGANIMNTQRDIIHTNELARKGGWQSSVVVQRDTRWQNAVVSMDEQLKHIRQDLEEIRSTTTGDF